MDFFLNLLIKSLIMLSIAYSAKRRGADGKEILLTLIFACVFLQLIHM